MKKLIIATVLLLALTGLIILDNNAFDACINKGYSINYCNVHLRGN